MLTLDAIPIGQHVRMVGFRHQAQGFRHKLLAMGLTPGVIMKIVRLAPLGDPVQVMLRGYTLSLRKKECQQIEVEYADGNTQQQDNTSNTSAVNACFSR
ncbi:MAG: hypothetical protein BGO43_05575 [Gammaproteobacteria bacterium 39-13]|nr:ferrous iron transport protein A [Gammaproteobacteria bacterium]OJV91508.1 MAG: hypothetical protein BGO43_05575 [Gammaproteobacteria bacterium 39-13]